MKAIHLILFVPSGLVQYLMYYPRQHSFSVIQSDITKYWSSYWQNDEKYDMVNTNLRPPFLMGTQIHSRIQRIL